MEDPSTASIKALQDEMVSAFLAGEMLKVASYYAGNATMVSANGIIAQGREGIDNYYQKVDEGLDWSIEILTVSESLNDILISEIWQTLEDKPLSNWDEFGLVIPEDRLVLYELMRSDIKYKVGDHTAGGTGTFVVVWEQIKEGEFKILIDSY